MAAPNPHAEWKPLGPQTEPRMGAYDFWCAHTMAGSFAGVDAMFRENGYGGTESHYGVAGSGHAVQWQDTDYQADANLDGNWHVISCETADRGESFPSWSGSDVPAWTAAQCERIARLAAHDCLRYNIPPVLVPDTLPGRRGLAVHRQGIDGNFSGTGPYAGRVPGGELWSGAGGKVCPGDRRIHQFATVVVPRIQQIVYGVGEFVMDSEAAAAFRALNDRIDTLSSRQSAARNEANDRLDTLSARQALTPAAVVDQLTAEIVDGTSEFAKAVTARSRAGVAQAFYVDPNNPNLSFRVNERLTNLGAEIVAAVVAAIDGAQP